MAQTHDLIGWFGVLMDLRRNLYPFIPDKEWGEVKDKFNSLPTGWRMKNGGINKKYFPQVNRILDEIYMIFIKIMKSKGLLMPRTIDSSKAVIEM